jgi:hypothetical protein
MPIKPLTKPQFEFLVHLCRPEGRHTGGDWGEESYWLCDGYERRWLLKFEELGFMERGLRRYRHNPESYEVFRVTEKGLQYLYSNGIESRKQYRARRRAQGKAEREESAARRQVAVEKNLGELDDFLAQIEAGER